MKIVDRIFYWLLSVLVFIVSLISIFGYINIFGLGEKIFSIPVFIYKDMNFNTRLTLLVISFIFNLMAIKGMFFQAKNKNEKMTGILLENNNGKLSISKETIANLIKDVAEDVDGIDVVKSDNYLDSKGNLAVKIDITVYKEVNIKEVSKELQEKVKRAIKNMTDIETSDVNIVLKNISNKKLTKNQEIKKKFEKIEKEKPVLEEKEEDK